MTARLSSKLASIGPETGAFYLSQGKTCVDANVSNVRMGENDKLSSVAWVCHDLLVPRDGSVEDDLANFGVCSTERLASPYRTVCKH